jgi:hypothetical protein
MRITDKPSAALPTAASMRDATKVGAPKAFSRALGQVQQSAEAKGGPQRTVGSGDTLIGLVREQASAQGLTLSGPQEMRLAQRVASDNGIQNANRIFTGQKISLGALQPEFQAMLRTEPATSAIAAAPAAEATPAAAAIATSAASAPAAAPPMVATSGPHPVLEKTLERAVTKGFIPVAEKAAVHDKILQLASTHRFAPDDFARMTLMESDGMNPRSSNQRCHGIIQFCDGPDRGAASVGYRSNPKAILGLSVNQQLDLVGKYFDDVGLKNQGPAGLEDLYLSVLNPASRSEPQASAPLNIPGPQASSLHVGRDTSAPITRQSIRQGLVQNASERLAQIAAPVMRMQGLRAARYDESSFK